MLQFSSGPPSAGSVYKQDCVTSDEELRPLALCLRSHEVKLPGRVEPALLFFSPATEACLNTCGMELLFCGRGHFSESRRAAEWNHLTFSNQEGAKMFSSVTSDTLEKNRLRSIF